MTTIWDEKTLKIAQVVVIVLGSVAAAFSTIVATLGGLGVDVGTLVIIMTIIDGLASAVAAFFGFKKNEVMVAQKTEIATLKAEAATAHNIAVAAMAKKDDAI